jgi:hypothetical protein
MDAAKSKRKEKRKIDKAEKKLIAEKIVAGVSPSLKAFSKPKKKDGGFTRFLKGALGVATDLVPALLPFVLGSHSTGKALMASAGPQAAGVPVATGQVCGNLCGLKSIRTMSKDSRGNITSIVVSTMDYLMAIPMITADAVAGDILVEAWVNPLDPSFAGTKFAEYGNLNERYKIRRGAFVYEATTPSTTPGALAMCVFDDPLVQLDNLGGDAVLRAVASQVGAETFQIWEAGCCSVPVCKDLLYTEPDNTDVRLSVAGKLAVVAASGLSYDGFVALDVQSLGNLYFLSETEYSIPSIADGSHPGDALTVSISSMTGTAGTPVLIAGGNVMSALGGAGQYNPTSVFNYNGASYTASSVSGLAPGNYLGLCRISGSSITAGAEWESTDEGDSYGVEVDTVDGVVSTTSAASWTQFIIPTGIPDGMPTLCLTDIAGTSTTGFIFLVMVNPEGINFDGDIPKLAIPRRIPGVPDRDGKRHTWARTQFYSMTLQGKAAKQDLLMHYLVQTVSNARTPLTPVKPSSCGYQSFSDMLPALTISSAASSPTTRVERPPPRKF